MSATVRGRVSSVKVFEGRTDLVAVALNTGTDAGSGVYNCPPESVSLNGSRTTGIGEIACFVTGYRRVYAAVTGPDRGHAVGDGPDLLIPCEAISLTALE